MGTWVRDTRRGFWLGTRSTLLILCDLAWLSPPAYTAKLRSPCSLWPPPSCVLFTHIGVLPVASLVSTPVRAASCLSLGLGSHWGEALPLVALK